VWGGGAKMATQAIPPPQDGELTPKSADSGGVTSPHYVGEVSEDANRAPRCAKGCQVDAKEVT
jgi:hypothetical protein